MKNKKYIINTHSSIGSPTGAVYGSTIRECIDKALEMMPWLSYITLCREYLRVVKE